MQYHSSRKQQIWVRPQNLRALLNKDQQLHIKTEIERTRSQTQRNALRVCMMSNDRESAWRLIRDGYRQCPLVALYPAFQINDSTAPMTQLVELVSLIQQPLSEAQDHHRVQRLINAFERSNESRENEGFTGFFFYFPQDHEKVEDLDKPAARWFLLYLQLDIQDWAGARETLIQILRDIITGHWHQCYLVEALYFASLIEFACSEREACAELLEMYQAKAHYLDRHRRDVGILKLWVEQASSDTFNEALERPLTKLAHELSRTWDSDTFSEIPWVLTKVAANLGVDYQSPFQKTAVLIKQQWAGPLESMKPDWVDLFAEQLATSGIHGVTVRHRKTAAQKEREDEEDKRINKIHRDHWYDSDDY